MESLPFDMLHGNDNLRKHKITINVSENSVLIGSMQVPLVEIPCLDIANSVFHFQENCFPIPSTSFSARVAHFAQLLPQSIIKIPLLVELPLPSQYPIPYTFIPSYKRLSTLGLSHVYVSFFDSTLLFVCTNFNNTLIPLFKDMILGRFIKLPLSLIDNLSLPTTPLSSYSISHDQLLKDVNPDLKPEQSTSLISLINSFQSIFVTEGERMYPADVICPCVQLKVNAEPRPTKTFRRSPLKEQKIQEYVDELLKQGVIL
jgi:hypothetical protein